MNAKARWKIRSRRLTAITSFFWLAYLVFGGLRAFSAASNPGTSFADVQSIVEKSGGELTPELRAAYLKWAESTVQDALAKEGKTIPPDCMAEVQADPTLQVAMFGAVDPPDPSILENYARLRAGLGVAFTSKYRSLVIADAVANRTNGARPHSDPGLNGEAPDPQPSAGPLVEGIAAYIKQTGVTTLTLFDDQQAQQKLAAYLQAQKVDPAVIGQISDQSTFHAALKGALVALGQRPAYRDPAPDDVAWLRYLASIYETAPASLQPATSGAPTEWPRFPMADAPWPLLMPLHHAYPLREATYIWEKYEGLHGPERFHVYGPYKKLHSGEWELELQPSAWHWNAWPDLIVHGGVCTTIAPMAVETYVTLCEPAVMAGQPGHSNFISFDYADGFWFGTVRQAFAGGPDATHGSWLFNEIGTAPGLGSQHDRPWAAAEYHLGLALAMNLGVASYMDTRMAVNIHNHLPPADLHTVGVSLLTHALQINPYNAALWHLLGKQTASPVEGIALVRQAMQMASTTSLVGGTASMPQPVEKAVGAYWNVTEEKLALETILNHPVPQDAVVAKSIYDFLKTVPGLSDAQVVPYVMATQGTQTEEARLESIVNGHLHGNKRLANNKAEKRFSAELKAFLRSADKTEGTALVTSLKTLLQPLPADDPYVVIVNGGKPKSG